MTSRRLHLTGLLAACVAAAALPATVHAAAPTDPQAASQQPLQQMHVGQALDLIARPLADVPVMVADTGLEWSNPDINPRLWRTPADSQVADPDNDRVRTVPAGSIGWDFIGGANSGRSTRPDIDPHDPDGGSGHGTATAGLLGAAWNNGIGSAGVAPNARFLAARTCWDGDLCYEHIQGAAIDWAAGLGVRVVSFSWLSGPLDADSPLRKAIVDHPDVLFVTIPSGNAPAAEDADAGETPMPCGLDAANVLCVSTSAPDDGLDCGAYGATSVDVAVPTQGNYTTRNGFTLGGPVSQGPIACATSWAAPTAAGLATILFGIDPIARPADVRAAIVDSARRVPAWQGKSVGGGVADAAAAVALFQQRRGIAGTTPPPVVTPPGDSPRRGPVIRPGSQDLVRPRVLAFRATGAVARSRSNCRRRRECGSSSSAAATGASRAAAAARRRDGSAASASSGAGRACGRRREPSRPRGRCASSRRS